MNNQLAPFSRDRGRTDLAGISADMIEAVFASFIGGFAASSKITMRYSLRRFADDIGFPVEVKVERLPWHTVTASIFHETVTKWNDSELSKSTIRLYMHAIRGLMRALYIRGLYSGDEYHLLREVRLPKGRNRVGRGRAIERQYRDDLLAACMGDDRPQGVRDAAIIALLFGSGMRRAEAASILCENMSLDNAEVNVKVKGGDTVTKYLAAWSIPYIRAWLEIRNAKRGVRGPLFTPIIKGGRISTNAITGRGIYYLLQERSIHAGLPFIVKPHDARRTIGTQMLSDYGDIIAQRVLGHANLSTTAIYDKRSDEVVKNVMRDSR